jgi:adenylate kinase family enzyme
METIWHYLSQLAASNQFLQGGMVLAAISWAFYQLKSFPQLVWRKFKYFATYQIYFDHTGDFYEVFSEWFASMYPQKFRNVEVKLWWDADEDDRRLEQAPVAFNAQQQQTRTGKGWLLKRFQFNDSNVIFYQNRWLWVRKEREKRERGNDGHDYLNSYTISGLFARSAIESLCEEVRLKKEQLTHKDSLRVGVNTEGGGFEWKDVTVVKTFDHIFFAEKDALVADLDRFVAKKEFYRTKGINFKRSYLFFGPPGTGKTSVATAIAKHLVYTLHVINLASIKDDLVLQRMATYIGRKSVVLLEDIDCVLTDRDVKSDNLNFSTVLNFLDGLYAPSDCVFVLTTNHPEALDEALTRKGRVDFALRIGYPSVQDIEAFMSDFYETEVRIDAEFARDNLSMSSIQDICLRTPDVDDAVMKVQRPQLQAVASA